MKHIVFTSGYFDGDDDLTSAKGHRSDVLFCDDEGFYYELNFITLDRLAFEFRGRVEKGNDHLAYVGLVVLNSISKDSIVKAVRKLVEERYFSTQKQLSLNPDEKWFAVEL